MAFFSFSIMPPDITTMLTLTALSAANHIIVETIYIFLKGKGFDAKYNNLLMIFFGIVLVLLAQCAGVKYAHSSRTPGSGSAVVGIFLLGLIVAGGTAAVKTGLEFLQSHTPNRHQSKNTAT